MSEQEKSPKAEILGYYYQRIPTSENKMPLLQGFSGDDPAHPPLTLEQARAKINEQPDPENYRLVPIYAPPTTPYSPWKAK